MIHCIIQMHFAAIKQTLKFSVHLYTFYIYILMHMIFSLFFWQIKKKLLWPKNSEVRCYLCIRLWSVIRVIQFQTVSIINNCYWIVEITNNTVATPFIIEKITCLVFSCLLLSKTILMLLVFSHFSLWLTVLPSSPFCHCLWKQRFHGEEYVKWVLSWMCSQWKQVW